MKTSDVSILDREVSLFQGSYDTRVRETLTLGTVLDRIENGHYAGYVSDHARTIIPRPHRCIGVLQLTGCEAISHGATATLP